MNLVLYMHMVCIRDQVTFVTPVGDRGALVIDDAFLWTTNADATASNLDGDNEVLESTGALVCDDCQVCKLEPAR